MQLKKQHAEVSKNVARALEKVNKIGYGNPGNSGNVSGRNLVSKPRSHSMDRPERVLDRLYDRDKVERVERVERVQSGVSRDKENKYRIVVPPINRPPSRNNNLSKKYLPPQHKMY